VTSLFEGFYTNSTSSSSFSSISLTVPPFLLPGWSDLAGRDWGRPGTQLAPQRNPLGGRVIENPAVRRVHLSKKVMSTLGGAYLATLHRCFFCPQLVKHPAKCIRRSPPLGGIVEEAVSADLISQYSDGSLSATTSHHKPRNSKRPTLVSDAQFR